MRIISDELNLKNNFKLFFDSIKVQDIILLEGPIGAGKTTLVRNYVDYLNSSSFCKQKASSPSYNLIQEYNFLDFKVIHIDLYRIENEDDLESTGFWEILQSNDSVVFIEWPEKINISDLNMSKIIKIKISIKDNHREFEIEK